MIKKIFIFISISGILLINSCSKDDIVLAKYTDNNKKTHSLKIKDVKNELYNYILTYDRDKTNDIEWHKKYFLDRYISLDLIYFSELENGLTNNVENLINYSNMVKRYKYNLLYKKAIEYIEKEMNNYALETVWAYHILISTADKKDDDAKQIALNILDSLKKEKNQLEAFKKIAKEKSDDKGSGVRGGDLGFFSRGVMIPEFENACFNQKDGGLVTEIVKSHFGYHIIYVKEKPMKRTISKMEKQNKEFDSTMLKQVIERDYIQSLLRKNYSEFYSYNAGKVVIQNKEYSPNEISRDSKMIRVYNRDYTWGEIFDIISLYFPNFGNELTIENFVSQMQNVKNFLIIADKAKINKYENSKEYKNEVDKINKDTMKYIAAQILEKRFREISISEVNDDMIKKYYENNKNYFIVDDGKGKTNVTPLKDVYNQIKDELINQKILELYEKWKDEKIKKYNVVFDEVGIKTLIKEEMNEVIKWERKRLDEKKKNF